MENTNPRCSAGFYVIAKVQKPKREKAKRTRVAPVVTPGVYFVRPNQESPR